MTQSIFRRKVGLRKNGSNTVRNENGMRSSDGIMKKPQKRVDSGPMVIAIKLVFMKEKKEEPPGQYYHLPLIRREF